MRKKINELDEALEASYRAFSSNKGVAVKTKSPTKRPVSLVANEERNTSPSYVKNKTENSQNAEYYTNVLRRVGKRVATRKLLPCHKQRPSSKKIVQSGD